MDNHEATLHSLQAILWPSDNPDSQWSPDTLQDVGNVLEEAGFGPPAPASNEEATS